MGQQGLTDTVGHHHKGGVIPVGGPGSASRSLPDWRDQVSPSPFLRPLRLPVSGLCLPQVQACSSPGSVALCRQQMWLLQLPVDLLQRTSCLCSSCPLYCYSTGTWPLLSLTGQEGHNLVSPHPLPLPGMDAPTFSSIRGSPSVLSSISFLLLPFLPREPDFPVGMDSAPPLPSITLQSL